MLALCGATGDDMQKLLPGLMQKLGFAGCRCSLVFSVQGLGTREGKHKLFWGVVSLPFDGWFSGTLNAISLFMYLLMLHFVALRFRFRAVSLVQNSAAEH